MIFLMSLVHILDRFRTFEPKRSCVYAGQTGFAGFLVSLVQKQGKAECKAALGTINHVQ